MAETGMPAAEYLGMLRTRAGQLLDQSPPGSYPRSLAAATGLIADRLAADDPAAAELAALCAFLAPEPVPEDLFTGAASDLPGELAVRAADPLAWRQTLAHLARQSLARIDQPRAGDAPAHPGHHARPAHPRAGRRHPGADRDDPGRQQPPRYGQSRDLAQVGAADAAHPGRRPGRHRQCGSALAGLSGVLLPAGPRRCPHGP